ncbi:XRE family transcriptional regulator [bacterium c-19]|nr:XRE family transcriptional regulator [bacterium c-19]
MKFADKLIQLRKKAGWSQEELAERMDVTRQSVSKWEGMQAVPDIEKIVRLSELFNVSTDYLLKDGNCDESGTIISEDRSGLRYITMDEAVAFLHVKAVTAREIALAVFMCILAPICLLILGAVSEIPDYDLSENAAGGIGMIVLLSFVSAAVIIFISAGRKTAPFEFLEKEIFETEYGVKKMVEERKEQFSGTYTKNNMIGSALCIMALVPLFLGVILDEENEILMAVMLCTSFVIAGIGIIFFINGGIQWASYEKLLQEGDYAKTKKEYRTISSTIASAYWLIITAVYLGYSLVTNQWEYSWIIWVLAGVLFPVIIMFIQLFHKKR